MGAWAGREAELGDQGRKERPCKDTLGSEQEPLQVALERGVHLGGHSQWPALAS